MGSAAAKARFLSPSWARRAAWRCGDFRSGDFDIDLGPVALIDKPDKVGTVEADDGSDLSSSIYNDAPNQQLYGLESDYRQRGYQYG